MLRYDRRMKINTNKLLFNGAGFLAIAIVAGHFVTSMFVKEVIPSCAGTLPKAIRLGVESKPGVPMSSIELQSRAGSHEWGVMENAKVVKIAGAPAPSVIEVKLTSSKTAPEVDGRPLSGIGMTWVPPGLSVAEAVCLSYDVWVPADFDFGTVGTLPGIFGGQRPDVAAAPSDVRKGFSARLAWNNLGGADAIGVVATGENAGRNLKVVPQAFKLPKNRWVHIDQEIVLNQPKGAAGSYRLWVDGELKGANLDVAWREDGQMRIGGVQGDIVYRGDKSSPSLRISPPVVAWR